MTGYKIVVGGGTFDHLHRGHKDFLRFALSLSEKVLMGITSDAYVAKHKDASAIEPFEKRMNTVWEFLQDEGCRDRVILSEIHDSSIPAHWEELAIDAIAVTEDTYKGAEAVNTKREERGLPSLPIETFGTTKADDEFPISSSRIRQGIINREGKLYTRPQWFSGMLSLPLTLRETLRKPLSRAEKDIQAFAPFDIDKTITVGDVTTKLFHDRHMYPALSVVDFIVERKKVYSSLSDLGFLGDEREFLVKNPAGSITGSLFTAVNDAFDLFSSSQQVVLHIDGEEDLSVLPVVLRAPLGFHVFYGQPGHGTVHVAVTEDMKQQIFDLAQRFEYRA